MSREEFEIFPKKIARAEIVEVGKKICTYVHRKKIKHIILIDRSARPAYLSILHNWHSLYPKELAPRINFINPKGFVSLQEIAKQPRSEIRFGMSESYDKFDRVEARKKVRSQRGITKDLHKNYSRLTESDANTILLFDTCMHTGDSIRPIRDGFRKMGFQVKLGIVSPIDFDAQGVGIKPDLVILNKDAYNQCYPFAKDLMVKKTYTSILSLRNRDEEDKQFSRQIRQEIRQALNKA